MRIHVRILFAALLALPGTAFAATVVWPGAAPCGGTLQSCIEHVALGDTIEIATNSPITETISYAGPTVSLTAAEGYHPVFQGVVMQLANTPSAPTWGMSVKISKLRFENGGIQIIYGNTSADASTIELSDLTIVRDAAHPGVGIDLLISSGGVSAMLERNRVSGPAMSQMTDALVRMQVHDGKLEAQLRYNQVAGTGVSTGSGILVDYSNTAAPSATSGSVALFANEVRGDFSAASILVSEGAVPGGTPLAAPLPVLAANNVLVGNGQGRGFWALSGDGTINAHVLNNTLTRLRYGLFQSVWNNRTGSASGKIRYNIVRASEIAVLGFPLAENDWNLFDGGALHYFTPGPNTLFTNARLVSDQQPRLLADSPAIDKGDWSTLQGSLIAAGAGLATDADGLRRVNSAPGAAGSAKLDLGAYEFGDAVFLHTATADNTTVDHSTTHISHPALLNQPDAKVLMTPNYNAGAVGFGVENDNLYSASFDAPNWSLVRSNTPFNLPEGAHFNVLAAGNGSGAFVHQATPAGSGTSVSDPSINGRSDKIILVLSDYSVVDPHPIGLYWNSYTVPTGGWTIQNRDFAAMPANARFHVYAQDPSPNAFRVVADSTSQLLRIDHPLLNNTPCALPLVTPVRVGNDTPSVTGNYDVFYDDDIWVIYGYDPAAFEPGIQFNVVVNPAQVAACSDPHLFSDGFEG